MTRNTILFFLAMSALFTAAVFCDEKKPAVVREIFVPETELGPLLEGAADRVLLRRGEYEKLVKDARKIRLRQDEKSPELPAEAVLLSSDYSIEIVDRRAVIDGVLGIELLTDDATVLNLPFWHVSLLEATLGDAGHPAPVGALQGDSVRPLVLEGKKTHRLRLRATTPLEIDSTRQGLRFRLPRGATHSLRLSIPGDVEMKSGAAVLSRKVENASTRFELLFPPSDEPVNLLMTLNSHRAGTYRAVLARSVQFAEVTEQYERLHATVSLNELHQGIREAAFRIPTGFDMTEVRSTYLDRWNVEKNDEGDILKITFREQITGLTTIHLSAIKTGEIAAQRWTFPTFRPLDVASDSTVLGLLLDRELELSDLEAKELFAIDTMNLAGAIPPGALEMFAGSPTLRLALAWYDARGAGRVEARFQRPIPSCKAETSQIQVLSEDEPMLRLDVTLTPLAGKMFAATIGIPERWKVVGVLDGGEKPLEFRQPERSRISVRFPRGVSPDESISFSLRAAGSVDGWFTDRDEKKLDFPVFKILEATEQRGTIFVRNEGEEDREILPLKMDGLVSLDKFEQARIAGGDSASPASGTGFRYDKVPFALELGFKRHTPRIKARALSFYRFEPRLLHVRHEIEFLVEQAATRQVSFLVTPSDAPTPNIAGLDSLEIEESFHEKTDAGQSRWRVRFKKPRSGSLRLSVDFQLPVADEVFEQNSPGFLLPNIAAENVAWQSRLLALEGNEELDLSLSSDAATKLRPIDAGFIGSAAYKPGKRLLGVYSAFDDTPVSVALRKNTTCDLVSGIVRHVSVTARLDGGARGGVLYSTLYEIQTPDASVRAALAESDRLWAVTLDGQTVKPQRHGSDILIPIPAQNGAAPRRLVLLYRSENFGDTLSFPELTLAGKETPAPLPVMQTTWTVIPPWGFEVDRLGDTPSQRPLPEPALFELFRGGLGCLSLLTGRPAGTPVFRDYPREMASPTSSNLGVSSTAVPACPYFQFDSEDRDELDKRYVRLTLDPLFSNQTKVDTFKYVGEDGEPAAEASEPEALPAPEVYNGIAIKRKSEKGVAARGRRLQSAQPVTVVVWNNDPSGASERLTAVGDRYVQTIPVHLTEYAAQSRWGWTSFLAVFLIGLAGLKMSRKGKAAFVFGLLTLGTLVVLLPGMERFVSILNGAVYAAALTGAVYLLHSLCRCCVAPPKNAVKTAAALLLLAVFAAVPLQAGEEKDAPKITLPADAIIVPYPDNVLVPESGESAGVPTKVPSAAELTRPDQTLWVPYGPYLEMLRILRSDQTPGKRARLPEIPYTVSQAVYEATIRPETENDLTLTGKIRIDVFSEKPVLVPLTLENSVLDRPMLDGKPASMQSRADRLPNVWVGGPGRHELTFGVRTRIARQGGWRIVSGKLPDAASTKVSLSFPDGTGDLLTGNPLDKRKWSVEKGQTVETALHADGAFRWQWRSAISEADVDRNLEVDSVIRMDVQEDGSWVHWTPTLKISRGRWDVFRLRLPKDYVIAEIVGENVRGWSVAETGESDQHVVDVELLKAAEKSETLSVRLFKAADLSNELRDPRDRGDTDGAEAPSKPVFDGRWAIPKCSVPESGIHRGRIDLMRSLSLNLRVLDSDGLSPTDPGRNARSVSSKLDSATPLGLTPYQSYRFVSEAYAMTLESKPLAEEKRVAVETALKITKRECFVESKIRFPGSGKPFYAVVRLPKEFRLKNVAVPDGVFWSSEKKDGRTERLDLSCGDGLSGFVEVLLEGDFGDANGAERRTVDALPCFGIDFPEISSENIPHETRLAVLVEPSLDIRTEGLKNCRSVSPDSVFSWLTQPEQRQSVRIALEATGKEFDGRILLSPRTPEVRCSTITNVRTTAEAIEETILLDFAISRAGIRAVEFVLPSGMADAKIDAPLLKRKTVSPEGDSSVLVRLELREDVMEQFRVLVRTDRALQAETDYRITVPVIRTGRTASQYVVMENDRRSPDEMLVDPAKLIGLRPVSRQQKEWAYLASILGTNVTEAYYRETPDEATTGSLEFRMRRREAVRLAEARIDLAETRVVLGDNGVYRAEQIYRIDNKKEPYLDFLMPEGATLWGARLLSASEWQRKEQREQGDWGQPVKPCFMPEEIALRYPKAGSTEQARRLRIPLVKTESGDLDYVVRLVYAGLLPRFHDAAKLDLPFIEVLNVPIGQSLVRLFLPEHFDYRFGGNLQQARQEGQTEVLRQAEENYQRLQTDRLRQAVRGDNVYARKRAKFNLGMFGSSRLSLSKEGDGALQLAGDGRFVDGDAVRMMVTPQVIDQEEEEEYLTGMNSVQMESQFAGQTIKQSGKVMHGKALRLDGDQNNAQRASNAPQRAPDGSPGILPQQFNNAWFDSNRLSNEPAEGRQIQNRNAELATVVDDLSRSDFQVNQLHLPKGQTSNDLMGGRQVTVGLSGPTGNFSVDLSVPVTQTPFNLAEPTFGGFHVDGKAKDQVYQNSYGRTDAAPQQRSVQVQKGNIVLGDASQLAQNDPLAVTPAAPPTSSRGTASELFKQRRSGGEISGSGEVMKPRSAPVVSSSPAPASPAPVGGGKETFGFNVGYMNGSSKESAKRPRSGFGSGGGGMVGGMGGAIDAGAEFVVSAEKPTVHSGADGVVTMDGRATGYVTPPGAMTIGRVVGNGNNDYSGKTEIIERKIIGVVVAEPVEEGTRRNQQLIYNGENLRQAGYQQPEMKELSTRSASLDIEIPYRGKAFLFTTPQGSLELSLRTVSVRTESRGLMLGAALLGLALLYGVYRLCLGIGRRWKFDRRTHRNVAGLLTLLACLLLFVAPLVFVVAIIAATVLWTTFFRRKKAIPATS